MTFNHGSVVWGDERHDIESEVSGMPLVPRPATIAPRP